jgi:PAS domain S-box-containing protein
VGKLVIQNQASEKIWAGSATVNDVEDWGKYRAFHPDGSPYKPGDWSMARCLRARETVAAEDYRIQRFDGTYGYLLGSCAPLLSKDGTLLGAVSVFADITEFKRIDKERAELLVREQAARAEAEAAREEAEALQRRLSVTLTSIGDAVIATDPQGKVTFLNPVAETLTGWTAQEAQGKPLVEVFKIINEETRKPAEDPVAKVIQLGKVVGLANHTALISKNGTETSIGDSAAPIRDAAGTLMGVVLVFRDMTEEKKAELALRTAQKELEIITDSMEAVVSRCGDTFRYVGSARLLLDGSAARQARSSEVRLRRS